MKGVRESKGWVKPIFFVVLVLGMGIPVDHTLADPGGRFHVQEPINQIDPRERHSIPVVTTTTLIWDIARHLAGPRIRLRCLIPIGGDPHLYEPVPDDARNIYEARLVLKNGLLLEGWLNELIEHSGTRALQVEVSRGVEAIQSQQYHGSPDPHAWMDPMNVLIYSRNIAEALVLIDPLDSAAIRQRLAEYETQILATHREVVRLWEEVPQARRILITTHDAFKYYSRRYRIEVVSALGTSTDADVQSSDIQRIVRTVRERELPCIFVESTINPKLFEQIARDLGIVIGGKLYADSIGDKDSPASTLLDMILHNTRLITRGLMGDAIPVTPSGSGSSGLYWLFGLFGVTLLYMGYRLNPPREEEEVKHVYPVRLSGLSASYGKQPVLQGINLEIKGGKLYGIIGPNGAGKSTLFKCILGQVEPDFGTVQIMGRSPQDSLRHIAYIPQKEEIDWSFPATVEQIVRTGRYPHKHSWTRINSVDKKAAGRALEKVGMAEFARRQIGSLSGGQQQRVFLARALCQDAQVYLLDEPFVGVDIKTEEKIVDLLKELASEGKTVLVIHHDLSRVSRYFSDLILLNHRVVTHGPVERVFTDANIRTTYSGFSHLLNESAMFGKEGS